MMATFRQGDVDTIDYTPSSDVDVGDVVIVGELVGIAVRPIVADELGALNINRGVYRFTGDSSDIDIGDPVYWDASEEKVSVTSTGNKFLGVAVSNCAGDDSPVDVFHIISLSVPPGSGG